MNKIVNYAISLMALALFSCSQNEVPVKPNVLFISIDDLRPELNCYGKSHIISPNIDKLANDGMVFNRAYCNIPVCGASRASLLTGLYPTPTRFTDYKSRIDIDSPNITSLPELFKNNGYHTVSIGKIFHHPDDGLAGWSKKPYRPDYPNDIAQQELWRDYQSPENAFTKENDLPLGAAGPAWEAADVADSVYYDGKTTVLALNELEELAKKKSPFFLGVGFIRPHLPFNAPRKYWDLYDHSKIDLADNPFMPENAPKDAWHNWGELRSYNNIPNDTLPLDDETSKMLRHGYYACVSYIDAQVGQIIDKLKQLGIYENTIIVLWGDHGWSLGEHTLWCKHSCLDNALKAAFIMRSPSSMEKGKTNSLVSYVDIYPTLCDLANIEKPSHLQGKSMVRILDNPNEEVNKYVFSRWINGEIIKSDRYIYTQYFNNDNEVKSHMLYDHLKDPNENVNVVDYPENKEVVGELSKELSIFLDKRSKK